MALQSLTKVNGIDIHVCKVVCVCVKTKEILMHKIGCCGCCWFFLGGGAVIELVVIFMLYMVIKKICSLVYENDLFVWLLKNMHYIF